MPTNQVKLPYEYLPLPNVGKPISSADIFVGKPGLDPEVVANQKTVTLRQEDGTETAAIQPISTGAGGVPLLNGSPVELLVGGDYSLKILSSSLSQIYFAENVSQQLTTSNSSISFDTVADMVADTGLDIGNILDTAGYLAKGDSGDNGYEVVAAATGTADGFNFIDLATHQAKALFPGGIATLKQAGAVGDGVADDEPAVQAVIDSAPISCYVPSGKYFMGSQLDIPATTRSLRFFTDAPATLTNDLPQAAEFILGFDGIMFAVVGSTNHLGIEFTNIRFDGDATNNLVAGTCFNFTGEPRRILLDNCYIEDFRDFGLNCVSVGGMVINQCQIFNNGININGDGLADSFVYGGQTGSGAGGGAAWVGNNISIQGSSGNTHFIGHRPNFSAGIGVVIGGNATRITFSGGICDQNLLGGFSLEDQCTAIKIIGMDIFENGTTAVNQPGILINTSQDAAGFVADAGISIIGNSIFDRAKGAAGERQDVAIEFNTGGSVNNTTIVGNGLGGSTTPIKLTSNILTKTGVNIAHNVGYVTELANTTATFDIGSTGVKTIAAVDVSALTDALQASTIILLTLTAPTDTDFAATLMPTASTSGTTFDIKINVTTASANGSATAKVHWKVINAFSNS